MKTDPFTVSEALVETKATGATAETARLKALRRCDLLDTSQDAALDDFARLAAHICKAPIALITLIDADWLWFKARIGVEGNRSCRNTSFCRYVIKAPRESGPLIVPDARKDARFADNPFVTSDPSIRFYAGAPLITPDGHALGSLCVVDTTPRDLPPADAHALTLLSRQVMHTLELRRIAREQQRILVQRRLTQAAFRESQETLEQKVIESAEDIAELRKHYLEAMEMLADVLQK